MLYRVRFIYVFGNRYVSMEQQLMKTEVMNLKELGVVYGGFWRKRQIEITVLSKNE